MLHAYTLVNLTFPLLPRAALTALDLPQGDNGGRSGSDEGHQDHEEEERQEDIHGRACVSTIAGHGAMRGVRECTVDTTTRAVQLQHASDMFIYLKINCFQQVKGISAYLVTGMFVHMDYVKSSRYIAMIHLSI